MDLIKRASQRIAERLTWCIAHRDQAGMAKDLAEGKDILKKLAGTNLILEHSNAGAI